MSGPPDSGGQKLELLAGSTAAHPPTDNKHVATKQYVDDEVATVSGGGDTYAVYTDADDGGVIDLSKKMHYFNMALPAGTTSTTMTLTLGAGSASQNFQYVNSTTRTTIVLVRGSGVKLIDGSNRHINSLSIPAGVSGLWKWNPVRSEGVGWFNPNVGVVYRDMES